MRILCVTPFYKPAYVYGGPVNSISILCETLVRKGHEITVFTTNANGNSMLPVIPNKLLNVDGVHVIYFNCYRLFPKLYFFAPSMARALRAQIHKFDVVYASTTWTYPMIAVASAASRAAVPYILSPRGDLMDWSMEKGAFKKSLYLNFVERKNIDRSAIIHCTSWAEKEQLEKLNFRPAVKLIPNGINIDPFLSLPPSGLLRQKLNIPLSASVSLFVGRLQKVKRVEDTVRIFSQVLKSVPSAHLMIVGGDEDGTGRTAKRLANVLGIQSHVHFLGALQGQHLSQAYADADLLVLLSHKENFSMVVAEAMSAKLPVIVSPQVAISKDVVQAGAGYIVDPDGIKPEEKWIELLLDAGTRSEMGSNAFELVMSSYSVEKVSDQMLRLFDTVKQSWRKL
jgi:glycosyltransferase involved in cell wall biosynthesis